MSEPLRILLTGFGPFPGAPFNPTIPLVQRLAALRRPALDGVELSSHIFHVTYRTVDRELPELISRIRPDAMLMFGLANRTAHLRIETRARNAVTTTFPDADRNIARKGSILPGAHPMAFGPHMAKLLRAARATGIDARSSRDAGSYLCNYLSWRAIEATRAENGPRLAAFIHIPLLARDGTSSRRGTRRITLDGLVDAGEAMLMELAKLARQSGRGRLSGEA
jgi:pyroglutamyl-peptidase